MATELPARGPEPPDATHAPGGSEPRRRLRLSLRAKLLLGTLAILTLILLLLVFDYQVHEEAFGVFERTFRLRLLSFGALAVLRSRPSSCSRAS